MNRRRLLAWLGLAPIAAVPAIKAAASEAPFDEAFYRLAKECFVHAADWLPSSDRRFPIRRAGG